ncbi:MAG: hypothetical protein AAGH19_12100 [Pseudomonadota bacterium]
MLSCFNLAPGKSAADFEARLAPYVAELQALDLVVDALPVGERRTDTILDTDEERSHRYFMIMRFRDKAQSDASVAHIEAGSEPCGRLHRHAYAVVRDPVFICWEVDDEGSPCG